MDFGTTLKHIAPFAIPILALFIPLVAICLRAWGGVRRNRELHETIRQISSQGQVVPAEVLAMLERDGQDARRTSAWTPTANLRAGLINVGLGAGLMVLLTAVPDGEGWMWAVGALPLCLGLALLAAWRLERGAH
jgi:hypothetical protein